MNGSRASPRAGQHPALRARLSNILARKRKAFPLAESREGMSRCPCRIQEDSGNRLEGIGLAVRPEKKRRKTEGKNTAAIPLYGSFPFRPFRRLRATPESFRIIPRLRLVKRGIPVSRLGVIPPSRNRGETPDNQKGLPYSGRTFTGGATSPPRSQGRPCARSCPALLGIQGSTGKPQQAKKRSASRAEARARRGATNAAANMENERRARARIGRVSAREYHAASRGLTPATPYGLHGAFRRIPCGGLPVPRMPANRVGSGCRFFHRRGADPRNRPLGRQLPI
jgi:hypothetical protein